MTTPVPLSSSASVDGSPADVKRSLADRYRAIRSQTEILHRPLTPEDCTTQSMPDASPTKWHLGHTSWFFETLVLEAVVSDYEHFRDEFRVLFNSYYNTIGAQHPRPRRGVLSRPALEEVLAYRAHVDRRVLAFLDGDADLDPATAQVIAVGLNHEQQHQELILTDLKHLFSCNPLRPAYRPAAEGVQPAGVVEPATWLSYPEGIFSVGHEGDEFAYDNESPRHRVFVEAYELAARPVTNGEFLAFMQDGGYVRPELWLSDGWATVQAQGWQAPLYWEGRDQQWSIFSLAGMRELDPREPVCHVSYYEADAFARWSGARLPTEAEWELAASAVPIRGNFVENTVLHPVAMSGSTDVGPRQLFGDVWEWTKSGYQPYPGYAPPGGPLGEYNSKFMCSQLVLRGGSCATPRSHIRSTYRNFFQPEARWQFSGVRLARDAM